MRIHNFSDIRRDLLAREPWYVRCFNPLVLLLNRFIAILAKSNEVRLKPGEPWV